MAVNAILDTCTFIWLTQQPERLSKPAVAFCDDSGNALYLSLASIWEISLKWTAGRIPLPAPPRAWITEQTAVWAVKLVSILPEHLYRATELAKLHPDPFDRLIVAQALAGGYAVVTPDPHIRQYPVQSIW
jgi:PIN domain nuclease of toxin-antitoxin system